MRLIECCRAAQLRHASARMDAAVSCGDPLDEQQRALGVRHSAAANDEIVNPLSRQAEQSGELCLFAVAAEQRPGGCDKRVPQRRIGAGTQSRADARTRAFVIRARDATGRFACDRGQTVGYEEHRLEARQVLHGVMMVAAKVSPIG
jgi:hypothetical protein